MQRAISVNQILLSAKLDSPMQKRCVPALGEFDEPGGLRFVLRAGSTGKDSGEAIGPPAHARRGRTARALGHQSPIVSSVVVLR